MNNSLKSNNKYSKLFDEIKQTDSNGNESWSARKLQKRLGYSKWENFEKVIDKAKSSLSKSGLTLDANVAFPEIKNRYKARNRFGEYELEKNDYKLSRYACYLIAQNGDPSKPEIAAAQSYFAIQTYRQEQMDQMSDEQKRLYVRSQVTKENVKLFKSAKDSGVYRYGTFTDAGYLGLYGMRARDIKKQKGIGKDEILNRAGATELAANLFRITQTQEKLRNELDNGNKIGDIAATQTHFMVGGKVRQTIKDIGGTLPENLAAEEDVKALERRIRLEDKKRLKNPEKPLKIESSFDQAIKKIVRKS